MAEAKRYCDKSQDYARQGKSVKGDRTQKEFKSNFISIKKSTTQQGSAFYGGSEEILRKSAKQSFARTLPTFTNKKRQQRK